MNRLFAVAAAGVLLAACGSSPVDPDSVVLRFTHGDVRIFGGLSGSTAVENRGGRAATPVRFGSAPALDSNGDLVEGVSLDVIPFRVERLEPGRRALIALTLRYGINVPEGTYSIKLTVLEDTIPHDVAGITFRVERD